MWATGQPGRAESGLRDSQAGRKVGYGTSMCVGSGRVCRWARARGVGALWERRTMKYTDTLSLKLVMCHGLYHDGGGASGQIGHDVAYIKHAFKVGPRPPQPVAVWRRATQGPAAGIGRPADGRNSSFTDSRRHRRAHSLLVSQTSDKRGPRASTCCGAARAAACPSGGLPPRGRRFAASARCAGRFTSGRAPPRHHTPHARGTHAGRRTSGVPRHTRTEQCVR